MENALLQNPQTGISLGSNLFKLRLRSKSKGKGKGGGFRIITYLVKESDIGTEIYLITIYDKSEEATITKEKLQQVIANIFN